MKIRVQVYRGEPGDQSAPVDIIGPFESIEAADDACQRLDRPGCWGEVLLPAE